MGSAADMRHFAEAQSSPVVPIAVERPGAGDFLTAEGLLRLEECTSVASGGTRIVYQHPLHDDMLIKVIRPDITGKNGAVVTPPERRRKYRIARLRPFGVYVTFHRELRETLRLARRNYPRLDFAFPFPRTHGLIWTTSGLGLIVEKICSADNSLAPSLDELLTQGAFTQAHWEKLKGLFDLCARNHLVAGDLHAQNFLYEDKGEGRFVIIDSIGEKSLIPIYELSSLVNRIKLRRKLYELKQRIERRTGLRLREG